MKKLDFEKIKEYLLKQQENLLTEVQNKFDLSAYGLCQVVKSMERKNIMTFDKGVVYKVCFEPKVYIDEDFEEDEEDEEEEDDDIEDEESNDLGSEEGFYIDIDIDSDDEAYSDRPIIIYEKKMNDRIERMIERVAKEFQEGRYNIFNYKDVDHDDECEEKDSDFIKQEVKRQRIDLIERLLCGNENNEDMYNDDESDEDEDKYEDDEAHERELIVKQREKIFNSLKADIGGNFRSFNCMYVFNKNASPQLTNLYGTGKQIEILVADESHCTQLITDNGAAIAALCKNIDVENPIVKDYIEEILQENGVFIDKNILYRYIIEPCMAMEDLMQFYAVMDRIRNLDKDKWLIQKLQEKKSK